MANPQPIVGKVLAWAIAEAGLTPAALDEELGADGAVESWIAEKKPYPNQGQLDAIARTLGRPPSFFFLPEPPRTPGQFASYRVFAGTDTKPGRRTASGLQQARTAQRATEWIRQRTGSSTPEVPKLTKSADIEEAAERLSDWLGWQLKIQTAYASDGRELAQRVRRHLEDRGVIVMHLTLDEGVTRGFSLPSKTAPLIAVNTSDDYRPRVFSYFHELVHLALRSGAVCDVHQEDDKEEKFCNRVAAAILMPRDDFIATARKLGHLARTVADVAFIRSRYRVSLRAAAIRAETLGVGVPGLFDTVDQEAEAKGSGGGGGGGRKKPTLRVDTYGAAFVKVVNQGVLGGVLRDVQAAQLMRMSAREWADARELASRRSA